MNKRILRLPVKREYFEQIKSGGKLFEYRLQTQYWAKRLCGKTFDEIHVLLGYPKKGGMSRTLIKPWRGFELQTITHKHFGPDAVNVFAIIVT
jgi:hypothetical protein